ncbi:DegT/DnrJ/EryC1/StrS family aminotransferase [Pseudanabaena sp. FACHB-1998]|uniref:DegT/DnrJ/EryC1/StrS family aminotransferase n=1 Tax=Pseudanabaena sp. FACHB-1998 TaxID=2692858 RepID=UPI0016814FEB|nr:DegT/DnrJ/EryC1/StrS family aminotransferase [Pseudanabaena sp. FACHB-1998]MBD2178266.1 DegT/DnrJ/EryC1/StrS family aminotransferase [Pseudanabaena sp. FACHB-1998]
MKVYPRINLDITIKDLSLSLISSFAWSDRAKIITQIQSYWHTPKEILVTLCVRTSFDLLLQALSLPAGSEIMMSAVNIGHMEEIVKKHNLIPIPIDIDLETLAPSLELFKASISSRSRLFVVAHLFGAIAPLDAYVEICQRHNILLVEDCAQAFDGLRYLGHPDADINLFSFGPIKSCSALGGSITIVHDQSLAERMREIEQTYLTKSNFWFFKRLLKYLCLKSLSTPIIFGLLVACLDFLKIDTNNFISTLTRGFGKGDIQAQLRYRPPNGMLRLLQQRLEHLDASYYDRRSQVARDFLNLLENSVARVGKDAISHSYWVVPLMMENPEMLMQKLRKAGFDSTTGTTSLKSLAKETVFATKLMNSVLYLPIYASVPSHELTRLAQLINRN